MAQTAQENLRVAWMRRPKGGLGIWDTADSIYWIQISDSDSDVSKGKFTELSPHKAYTAIKTHINPLKNGSYRNKDGSFNCQIPKIEFEMATKVTEIEGLPVKIERHPYLNRTRGRVFHPDIKLMPEGEILDALKDHGVNKVIKKSRFNRQSNSQEITGELVLHFDRQVLPGEIDLDYLVLKVQQHLPQPPMCHKCYVIGEHITDKCEAAVPVCGFCAGRKHTQGEERCKLTAKCRNCEGNHPAWDKDCSVRKYLQEILEVKERQKVSYPRAKKQVDERRKKSQRNQEMFGGHQPAYHNAQDVQTHHNTDPNQVALQRRCETQAKLLESIRIKNDNLVQEVANLKAQIEQMKNNANHLPPPPRPMDYSAPFASYVETTLNSVVGVEEAKETSDSVEDSVTSADESNVEETDMEVDKAEPNPNTSVVSESKGSRKKYVKKAKKQLKQEKHEKRKTKITAKPDKKAKLESSDTAVK